jgi:hypothetical protein
MLLLLLLLATFLLLLLLLLLWCVYLRGCHLGFQPCPALLQQHVF